MTATTPIAVATAFLAMALAGCTGGFQVDQTEPFRVQLEGAPETVTVRESDDEPQKVVVETCAEDVEVEDCDVEEVDVQLEVTSVETGPCTILVTIQDEDGNTILTKTIEVNVNVTSDDDTTTTGNGTGNGTGNTTTVTETETASSGQSVIQNIVVNVKGNKNIIVLTQAQEGSADVTVQAIKASGNADVDADDDDGSTSSGNTTASSTSTTT